MSNFADLVAYVRKNPPPSTVEGRRTTELKLESAFNEDLEAIRSGELEDPAQFANDFLCALDDLIEVFDDYVTKED